MNDGQLGLFELTPRVRTLDKELQMIQIQLLYIIGGKEMFSVSIAVVLQKYLLGGYPLCKVLYSCSEKIVLK